MIADVYLHIGLQKTGTSYIQRCLWDSREQLAARGVLVPGDTFNAQTLATWDLLGRRPKGADLPAVPGSWQALVDEVKAFDGKAAVISHEILIHARARDVRRIARQLAPANLHVVLTIRDLGRTIGSSWQQELGKGQSWSWADYVAAVHEPEKWPATSGIAFWLRQDPIKTLNVWETAVERERIHVVTVPPPGAPVPLLLERFASAIGLPSGLLAGERPAVNSGVGAVEAEVLRRLNGQLGDLNERQYMQVVQKAVRRGLAEQEQPRPIRLDVGDRDWIQAWARDLVKTLDERGYPVSGELDDLVPSDPSMFTSGEGPLDEAEIADATMRALAAVTGAYAEFWWRARRRDKESDADSTTRLTSWWRAMSFKVRLKALDLADRNKFVAKIANGYLRRGRRT